MDERELIDNKIIENDLSKRCRYFIMQLVALCLLTAIVDISIIWFFNVWSTKIVALVVEIVLLLSTVPILIFEIISCICVVHLFKNAKFSVELDTITEIKPDRIFYISEFIPTRIAWMKFPQKITFENSGKIIVGKYEISEHCRAGDKFYLVKIKIFGRNKIVSFYDEKAYRYEDKPSKN